MERAELSPNGERGELCVRSQETGRDGQAGVEQAELSPDVDRGEPCVRSQESVRDGRARGRALTRKGLGRAQPPSPGGQDGKARKEGAELSPDRGRVEVGPPHPTVG